MLNILRWIGYVLLATLIIAIIVGGGFVIAAITAIAGIVVTGTFLIALIAAAIKEYFEERRAKDP